MIDKKTESDIKEVKSFLELWVKFHSIYNNIASKGLITIDDEKEFLETKGIIQDKYNLLKDSLEFNYMPHTRLTDPVSDILSLKNVLHISEKNLKKLGDDWKDSFIFLNNILERLKNKKRRLEQFNPIGVFLKRISERR